jgi:hypothetical protein
MIVVLVSSHENDVQQYLLFAMRIFVILTFCDPIMIEKTRRKRVFCKPLIYLSAFNNIGG